MINLSAVNKLAIKIVCVSYFALSLTGLIFFISKRATSVTEPVGKIPPYNLKEETNFALYTNRSWIEASSYAFLYIHHPLFAIDGIKKPPTQKEQWVPDRRTDKKPFFTVHFGRNADINRVVIYHDSRYTSRFYTVKCLQKGKVIYETKGVPSTEESISYPMKCKNVDSIRLDFEWDPYSAEGHIRLYEVEAWGR